MKGRKKKMNKAEVDKKLCKEYGTVLERVEMLLEEYPETRNDRARLIELYYYKFHGLIVPKRLLKGKDIPSMGTILRSQRKIQNTFERWQPEKKEKETRIEFEAGHWRYHNNK